jgi:hypothetical protein
MGRSIIVAVYIGRSGAGDGMTAASVRHGVSSDISLAFIQETINFSNSCLARLHRIIERRVIEHELCSHTAN